jgi:hypothetical protein
VFWKLKEERVMTSKKVVGSLSMFLAMMLVLFGAVSAPAGKPVQETPATADLEEHPNASITNPPPRCGSGSDSVFEDGLGPYRPEDGVFFRSNGDLWIPAGIDRDLELFLPADICALLGPGAWATDKLSIQAVRDVPDDGETYIVGDAPFEGPKYLLGYNNYFHFIVDSTGDGVIGKGDRSFNVVWPNGISVTRNGNNYVLSTDGTVAATAVLRWTVGRTVYVSPQFDMPLNLTATRQ